jgi:hypothetical protein
MSSNRRMPLNTSRSTTTVHRSPRISIARPIGQFSTDQSRASYVAVVPLMEGLMERIVVSAKSR